MQERAAQYYKNLRDALDFSQYVGDQKASDAFNRQLADKLVDMCYNAARPVFSRAVQKGAKLLVDHFDIQNVLNVCDQIKAVHYSPAVRLIRELLQERLGNSTSTPFLNEYLSQKADVPVGCDLIKLTGYQFPLRPTDMGDLLVGQYGLVSINGRLFSVSKTLNAVPEVREILLTDENRAHYQALSQIFGPMRDNKLKQASYEEIVSITALTGRTFMSEVEGFLTHWLPTLRKLKLSKRLQKKLAESPKDDDTLLYLSVPTDSLYLVQIKKLLNALLLIEQSLERVERLPANYLHVDATDFSPEQLDFIRKELKEVFENLYTASYDLTHPEFNLDILNEVVSFLTPVLSQVSSVVSEGVKKAEPAHIAKKIGAGFGFGINQLRPYQDPARIDYEFLTQFGAHIPGYLSEATQLIQTFVTDFSENEPTINKYTLHKLEKNAALLLKALDALRDGDLFASVNILNYVYIVRNSIALTQEIIKELGHLSQSSQAVIRQKLHELKYDCIAPLMSISDQLQTEPMLDSSVFSPLLGELMEPLYQNLVNYAQIVVDFSKDGQDLLTLDEPRFVEARLKRAYMQTAADLNRSLTLDEHQKRLSTFMEAWSIACREGTLRDELRPALIEQYRLLQPFVEQFYPRISNAMVRILNGNASIATLPMDHVNRVRNKLRGYFVQMKATLEFHRGLVNDCIDSVQQGVRDGCGLTQMSTDPMLCPVQVLFEGIKNELAVENALIGFGDDLYFADQNTKSVKQIELKGRYELLRMRTDPRESSFDEITALLTMKYAVIAFHDDLYRVDRKAKKVVKVHVHEKNRRTVDQVKHLFDDVIDADAHKIIHARDELALIQAALGQSLDYVDAQRRADFENLKLRVERGPGVADKAALRSISALTGRVFRDLTLIPWDIKQNALGLGLTASATVQETEQAIFIKIKQIQDAKKAYQSFLKKIERYPSTIAFSVFGADLKKDLRHLYALFQPMLISVLSGEKNAKNNILERNDAALIQSLSGEPQDFPEPITLRTLRGYSEVVFSRMKDHLEKYEHDLKQLRATSAKASVKADIPLTENKKLEEREDFVVKNPEFYLSLMNNLKMKMKAVFDTIDPAIRHEFLIEQATGLPFPEIEEQDYLDTEPRQILAYKRLKNALYYVEQTSLVLCDLRETGDVLDEGFLRSGLSYFMYDDAFINKCNYVIKTINAIVKAKSAYMLCYQLLNETILPVGAELKQSLNMACTQLTDLSAPYRLEHENKTDSVLYGLNALMTAPHHFDGVLSHDIMERELGDAKKASKVIWRIALDSSDSYFKLLLEVPTFYKLFSQLKSRVKLFSEKAHQATLRDLEKLRDDYFIPLLIEADAYEEKYCLAEGCLSKVLNQTFDDMYIEFLVQLGLPSQRTFHILKNEAPFNKRIAAAQERLRLYERGSSSYSVAEKRSEIKRNALSMACAKLRSDDVNLKTVYINNMLSHFQMRSLGKEKGLSLCSDRYDVALKAYVDQRKLEFTQKLMASRDLDTSLKRVFKETVDAFDKDNLGLYQQSEDIQKAVSQLEAYIQRARKEFFLTCIESPATLLEKEALLSEVKARLNAKDRSLKSQINFVSDYVQQDEFKQVLLRQHHYHVGTFSALLQVLISLYEACLYVVSLTCYTVKSEREQCFQAFFNTRNKTIPADDTCVTTPSPLKSGV